MHKHDRVTQIVSRRGVEFRYTTRIVPVPSAYPAMTKSVKMNVKNFVNILRWITIKIIRS